MPPGCCPILLSVPITAENYDETWKCIGTHGAYHPGLQAHPSSCNKKYQEESEIQLQQLLIEKERKALISNPNQNNSNIAEWDSNPQVLRKYIKENILQGPKSIEANMKKLKQSFSLKVIKETKKEIMNELYPKDKRIAFNPSNCLAIGAQDNYRDNLYKYSSQFASLAKSKGTSSEVLKTQEFYIFATTIIPTKKFKSMVYRWNFLHCTDWIPTVNCFACFSSKVQYILSCNLYCSFKQNPKTIHKYI